MKKPEQAIPSAPQIDLASTAPLVQLVPFASLAGAADGLTKHAPGDVVRAVLPGLRHGAILVSVIAYFTPPKHASTRNVTPPTLRVRRRKVCVGAKADEREDLGKRDQDAPPMRSEHCAAWSDGTMKSIAWECWPHDPTDGEDHTVIDLSRFVYEIEFTHETGENARAGTSIEAFAFSYAAAPARAA